ncbi:serine/threonine-protein phosphatase 7 long form homolog [Rutidosis leptorrhynchoides]|uniref:serine/threonine-protein phosphatase 7 long form homolog n=1 Tax=Rutidosis leptorrhynchoides TaxID=125765 RepID=UPI003A99C707
MAGIQVNEQPPNNELLWLQATRQHRSFKIFSGADARNQLNARRADKALWDHIKTLPGQQIHPRVFDYIRQAGLAGVFSTGFHKLDHALITALVERWRPETHTFHFSVCEAIVTLQNIQVLWGLPINGQHVSGVWLCCDKECWIEYCNNPN